MLSLPYLLYKLRRTTGSMSLRSSSSPVPSYILILLSCRCTVLYVLKTALISIRSFVIYITRISTYYAYCSSVSLEATFSLEHKTSMYSVQFLGKSQNRRDSIGLILCTYTYIYILYVYVTSKVKILHQDLTFN